MPTPIGPEGPHTESEPLPPFLVFDRDDYMYLAVSVDALVGWLESIDVDAREYECFDQLGREIILGTHKDEVVVLGVQSAPSALRLRKRLHQHYARYRPDIVLPEEKDVQRLVLSVARQQRPNGM